MPRVLVAQWYKRAFGGSHVRSLARAQIFFSSSLLGILIISPCDTTTLQLLDVLIHDATFVSFPTQHMGQTRGGAVSVIGICRDGSECSYQEWEPNKSHGHCSILLEPNAPGCQSELLTIQDHL